MSGVVMPAICDFLGDTTYDQAAQRGFQTRKMHELGLVGHYDTSKLEDHIEGIYSGVPYELVEAKLTTENRDIDSNTQTNVVFRGLLFRIELPQPAPCSILITRDYGKVLNKVAGFFSGKKGRGMARIETGHAEFESHFELHADFAQATLDYLPQAFLDNLMQIATTAADGGPEQMRIAFEGRDCWLAIGRKRDFLKMPPINKPVETIVDELHYVFEDLSLVRHIIDQLKA